MRQLILMRHAQATPAQRAVDDFERALTPNGSDAAVRAAHAMAIDPGPPQLILCSPAARTLATAHLIQQTLQLQESAVVTDSAIYLATVTGLKRVIASTDNAITRLLFIAHNPGVSLLLASLTRTQEPRALATAEFICLPLPIGEWEDLQSL